MSGETCPHCGAEPESYDHPDERAWRCGSSVILDRPKQHGICKDRELTALRAQLAAVTAERDGWRKDADDWLERYTDLCTQLTDLQQRIAAAPVVHSEGMTENDAYEVIEQAWSENPTSTFRLVAEPEPESKFPQTAEVATR